MDASDDLLKSLAQGFMPQEEMLEVAPKRSRLQIGIPKESQDNRIAMVPVTMKKIKSEQVEFLVEQNAGLNASLPDATFAEVATITDRATIFQEADIIVSVNPLADAELSKLKKGALLVYWA